MTQRTDLAHAVLGMSCKYLAVNKLAVFSDHTKYVHLSMPTGESLGVVPQEQANNGAKKLHLRFDHDLLQLNKEPRPVMCPCLVSFTNFVWKNHSQVESPVVHEISHRSYPVSGYYDAVLTSTYKYRVLNRSLREGEDNSERTN